MFRFKIFETYEDLTDFVNDDYSIDVVSVTENHNEIILWYRD